MAHDFVVDIIHPDTSWNALSGIFTEPARAMVLRRGVATRDSEAS